MTLTDEWRAIAESILKSLKGVRVRTSTLVVASDVSFKQTLAEIATHYGQKLVCQLL